MRVKLPEIVRKSFNIIPGVNLGVSKDASKISDLGNPSAWLVNLMAGVTTLSGEKVTQASAMELTAFFAAVRNISEDVAKLPFNIYERVEGGRKLRNDHEAFKLVHIQANPYTSQAKCQETLLHWALIFGNGYAELVKNGMGEIVEMWPIHPSRVKARFENKKLVYDVAGSVGVDQRETKGFTFPSDKIYHISGLSNDGITGYSVIALAAQALGKGLAIQNFGAAYFGNATALSGVLETATKLSDEALDRMRKSWNKIHIGKASKKHKVAILEQGLKFKPTSSTASEAQLIESGRQVMVEVAQLLRIPLPKIGVAGGLVKANFEAENISYYNDTLTPWIARTGHEMDRKVIRDDRFFAQHEVIALTLGDSKTRTGVIKTLRNTGLMSINEGRRLEGLNAIDEPWANEYHMQSNITTVQAISEGKNLKQDSGGVGSKPKGDSGVSESQAAKVKIEAIDSHMAGNMPTFKAAAHRVMSKEVNRINNLLKTMKGDEKGFRAKADIFYSQQKRDILEAFTPACETFISTFPNGLEAMSLDFLSDFADNYTADASMIAVQVFNDGLSYGVEPEQMEVFEEKTAKQVINLIVTNAKGVKDEA